MMLLAGGRVQSMGVEDKAVQGQKPHTLHATSRDRVTKSTDASHRNPFPYRAVVINEVSLDSDLGAYTMLLVVPIQRAVTEATRTAFYTEMRLHDHGAAQARQADAQEFCKPRKDNSHESNRSRPLPIQPIIGMSLVRRCTCSLAQQQRECARHRAGQLA